MMVVHLFAFVKPGTLILIFVTFICISVDVYTSMDGYTPSANIFSSYVSFYANCVLTDRYSTPLSSNFSMFTTSINVAPNLAYTLELQPLLRMYKNSTVDVLVLYIS